MDGGVLKILADTVIPLLMMAASGYLVWLALRERPRRHSALLAIYGVAFVGCVVTILVKPSPYCAPLISLLALIGAVSLRRPGAERPFATSSEERLQSPMLTNKIMLFSVFNNLNDLVLVINRDGMVTFMNQSAVDRLGDQVGSPCGEVLRCPAEACPECPVRRIQGEDTAPVLRNQGIAGREYELATHRMITDPDENVIVIARDITERKMVERQMLLNEKMVSLGQLVAGIAHEINNPITFVSTNMEMLTLVGQATSDYTTRLEEIVSFARYGGSPDLQKLALDLSDWANENAIDLKIRDFPVLIADMQEGIDRVKKLVKDLKEFAHQGIEEAQEADLNHLIRLTLRIAHHELKRNVNVMTELRENLPLIMGFPQQLKQALLNIVVNAAQAMNGLERPGSLRISTDFQAGWFTLRITDDGIGIPPEVLGHIFEPFYTTKPIGEGTGLGLAVVHGIITRHGGEIDVESTPGVGTTFIIRLPRIVPSEREKILARNTV